MIRALLLKMSEMPALARWVVNHGSTRRMSRRFVAGEELDDAVAAARECNDTGMAASLDLLGENVAGDADARRARDVCLAMFDRLAREKLNSNVSLKLTQLGLDLNESLCQELLDSVVERAASTQNFARIDMEGSPYTEPTIRIAKQARAKSSAVGTVIQSYLYRSEQDVRDLIEAGCNIRLVKGAYKEPAAIAFQEKSDVDANFVKLMQILLSSGLYHAIATHDPATIDATIQFASNHGIGKDRFEFQMLYGIRTDLQRKLVHDGYRMRIYIPFGHDWFPYFMRRLAERPANLLFFLRNLFRAN